MANRDDEEPGPRWQHPLGGFSTERHYGTDDLHTPRDYNRGGDFADYGRGGSHGGQATSGSGAYGTRGSYGDYRTGGSLRGSTHSGFRGSWGRERGEFVGDGRHPREWFGGNFEDHDEGPHAGRGPRDYRRSDERIRDEACDVLTRHGHVDATGVRVEVQDGEVTLEGTVGSRQQKRLAEDAVDAVQGVRDVHNRLRVVDSRVD
jgi:hypothetical protein